MLLVAGVFVIVGRTVKVSGGPYAYVKPILGPYWGYLCGVLLWFLATLAFASVSNAYAHFVGLLFSDQPTPLAEASILAGSLGMLAIFNSNGVKSGAKVVLVLALVKILPLVFLMGVGVPHLNFENLALPPSLDGDAISRGAMVLIFAFTGVESALIPSGEIENPERNLPRAILFSFMLVLVLYLGVHSVSQSVLGEGLAAPGISPLALAARNLVGVPGEWILATGAVLSTLGYLSAMTLSLPRSLLAFSEDGFLPKYLSKLSHKTHAPERAIWIQVAIVYVLAVTSKFEKLAVIANVSAILMYGMCAVAALILLKKQRKLDLVSFTIPVLAMAVMSYLLTSVTKMEWFSVILLIGLSTVLYGVKNRRASA
jgi:amino acid transporter